jgi:uncharacterized protein YgbK (DUF1537 family)
VLEAAFYGDDFTGSTDALLQFERCGLRAVLLVDLPPTDELRDLATRYDVIGVAGIARSLAPDEQEAEIRPILTALRDLKPRVVQYKICSTADSSPQLGSIGRALEVGRSVFGPAVVPVLAAQPELGRYTVFSHHFAAEAGAIHRLDRQPTMANHPTTPMTEADLRVHLAAQTDLQIGALHLTSYADLLDSYAQSPDDAVVLDALTDTDLRLLGQTLVASSNGLPLFTVGSGGLSRGLAMNLTTAFPSAGPHPPSHAAPTVRHWPASAHRPSEHGPGNSQVLVVSGSQSSRTREQIAYAVSVGWLALELRDSAVVERTAVAAFRDRAPGVVVHTGKRAGQPAHDLVGSLGEALAGVARAVVENTTVRRVVIAGGDTSGRVVRNLGVSAVELLTGPDNLGPGTAMCRVTSPDTRIDGLRILLKGGQIGTPDLFETFRTLVSSGGAR